MPDTTLDIGVRGGRDAKQVVDLVTQALRALGQQNAANARQAAQSAATAKSQADQLRGLANAAQASLQAQKQILTDLQRAAEQTKKASEAARADAVQQATTYAKAAESAAKYFETVAKGRLKEAQAQKITIQTPTGSVTTQNDALIAARRRELTEATENLARAQALGRRQIEIAQQVGRAETASANQQVAAQRQVVSERTRTTAAANAQAVAAERAAAQQARAAKTAENALRSQAQASQVLSQAQTALRNAVLRLVAAYSGFRAIEGFVAAGLRFNQTIESSKLGIGALITAEADLTDQQGNLLTGTKALAGAQVLAQDQLNKLRVAGIQTAATTEELVTAFQEAVGAGISVGLTLDQIRQFTVQVAQAATTINLPFNQLNQEVRSILQGTIDRNSRIAKALQLTNAEVNAAKEQNRLFDLLNEKFKAFNIAGIESVQTFAALRSNIQDAFSVLAGRATEPLFTALRDAGQRALAAIFDFKSADIQRSFQGLVQGAQIVFAQIGDLLSSAIATGVEKARAFSEWLTRNREEVKRTAAAITVMVQDFGRMVIEIGNAVTGFVTMGDRANTLIGVAQTLDAIFLTIKDSIRDIIALLAAQTLVTAIGRIVTAVIALRNIAIGAEVGTALGGPVGALVGGIGGLITAVLAGRTALRLFTGDEDVAGRIASRTTTAYQDQQRTLGDLARQYAEIQQAAQDKNLSDQDQQVLQDRLNKLIGDFSAQGGPGQAYLQIIQDSTLATKEHTAAIKERVQALLQQQAVDAKNAFFQQQAAAEAVRALEQRKAVLEGILREHVDPLDLRGKALHFQASDALKQLDKDLEQARNQLQVTTDQAQALNKALQGTFDTLNAPVVKPRKVNVPTDQEAPAIKAAKGELDKTKAQLDAARAQINAEFAARVIDAKTQIQRLMEVDLAEVEAEHRFLEAQRVEAERQRDRVIKNETPDKKNARVRAAQDAVNGILLQEQGLEFKQLAIRAEANGQLLKLDQERADKEEQIRINAMRAQGRLLDAELAEAQLKQRQALRQFDDENEQTVNALRNKIVQAVTNMGLGIPALNLDQLRGDLQKQLDLRAQVKLSADKQSLDDTTRAFSEEIQRILDIRTNAVQLIEDRFKQSGKLSAAEKQAEATQIAAANQQAEAAAAKLRDQLIAVRNAAQLAGQDTSGLDALLAKLDLVSQKTKVVNQEMERLRDGIREAFENEIGQFFEHLGDRATTLAGLFRKMVSDIINDLRRLVSQIIAQRIVQQLFGIAVGAATGGGQQPGNQTQSMGRAEGGPARPSYGRLQGGIRGVDSIPILAQEDEWFLKPAVRRKYGDARLKMLNELKVEPWPLLAREQIVYHQTKRFAQGGPVIAQPATARESVPQSIFLQIGVDGRGILRVLEGPVGKNIVVKHAQTAPRTLGQVLRPVPRRQH